MGKGMIVSWVTMDEPGSSTVLYWSENSKLQNKAKGIVVTYKFYNYTSGYIHHCTITNLKVPSLLYALYLLAILDYSLSLNSGTSIKTDSVSQFVVSSTRNITIK